MSKVTFKHIVSVGVVTALISSVTNAGLIDDGTWTGWTIFNDNPNTEDQTGNFNYVDPGYGGQNFDAEYLLYKYDNITNTLSIGLQTGFDVVNGEQVYGGKTYWAGDLALSFNGATIGDASSYEYAVDFGLNQCGWSQRNNSACGTNNSQNLKDAAGIYQVTAWNNDVYNGHHISDPFAMDTGNIVGNALTLNDSGSDMVDGELSYFRQVSIDLDLLGITDLSEIDAHWTMSCGNDAVNGSVSVPEPSALALLSLGLLGLGVVRVRMKK